jgi:ribonucleoside-diphosphate reductase alpha chain
MKDIFVIKRNQEKELLDYEKINKVLMWACEGVKHTNPSDIAMNAKLQISDGMSTSQIHQLLVQSAASLVTEFTPNYQYVASNLLNYFLRKSIFGVQDNLPHLRDVVIKNVESGVYDPSLLVDYNEEDFNKINKFIKHTRDYKITYGGLQQMIDKYLVKDRTNNKIYETPQYMYILIAMTKFAKNEPETRLSRIKSFYDDISLFKISLPTPIMGGVRTPIRQWSSCVLIDVDDSLDSIIASDAAVGYYTARRAGIGLNFGRIRSLGSRIRGGEVVHTGIIPILKKFEATTKAFTQAGIRGGGSTMHYPFWSKEIEDVLVLKNNKGTVDNRVRKMDYSIQFSRLFYKRLKSDDYVTLFSTSDVPELYESFFESNDRFEEIYEKYEADSTISKKFIKAKELFKSFLEERFETGRIYMMNVDHTNTHSSFNDTVKMSNLCQEITLITKPINDVKSSDGEIALCVLSAINLGEIKELTELESICENIVRGLDFVIENQDYPVKAAEKMLKRRSLGVGVTNLAYFLAKNGFKYEDKETLVFLDEVFECIQYYLLKASVKLAKEYGKCEYFNETKYSKGILPIDTYNKNVDSLVKREYRFDWEGLRKEILEHGLRNSTLTAIMPCESSSLTTNSTNGIEPPRAFITSKKSKQGVIRMVLPELMKLKDKYTLAFDIKSNTSLINIQAVIQKWIDQAISSNHYYNPEHHKDGKVPISVIGNDVLYSYKMGLKTLYYANTYDGKTDDIDAELDKIGKNEDVSCESGACSV